MVYHRLWMFGNLAAIVFSMVYIWFFRPHDSSLLIAAQLLAQIGMILFLVNLNMYFIFLVIRKTSVRKVKISLAKFSRYLMKWHIKIALIATTIIIGHAFINLYKLGPIIGFTHLKLITGYLAIASLSFTLVAGYLRHKKASGFRRKFHLITAFVFLGIFLLHMFIFI
ncbi:hypothetical protein [Neobacillus drentensis]|uniref:hypothetical protein n=1 Tax=Neobacillus drentensis TaxID=220684 RepID=UPI002FFF909D